MSSNQYTVLCVDNEQQGLEELKRLLWKEDYHVLTTSCTNEGLDMIEKNDIHLVINVQKTPDMKKNGFLKKVKLKQPNALRAIITGYDKTDSATELVCNGYIDRFFLKPWYDQYFKWEIKHTLERYDLIQTNKKLKKTIMKQQMALREMQNRLDRLLQTGIIYDNKDQMSEFTENILMHLSVPVIGVNSEQNIILVNQEALFLTKNSEIIKTGKKLYDYFPDNITGRVSVALHTDKHRCIKKCSLEGILYDIDYIPLTGRSDTKQGILVFRPL